MWYLLQSLLMEQNKKRPRRGLGRARAALPDGSRGTKSNGRYRISYARGSLERENDLTMAIKKA